MNTLLLLIIGIPLIEIYLFIKIGSQIGAFNTVLLILVTAVIGVAYVRYEGFNTIKSGIIQLAIPLTRKILLGRFIKNKEYKKKNKKNYIDGEFEDISEDHDKKI